jgi:hypothetical protein
MKKKKKYGRMSLGCLPIFFIISSADRYRQIIRRHQKKIRTLIMFIAPVVEEGDIHFYFSNRKEICTHLLLFEPDRMIILTITGSFRGVL